MSEVLAAGFAGARLEAQADEPVRRADAAAVVPASRVAVRAGRVMSAVPALFLLADGVAKLVKPAPVVEGTLALGYPEGVIVPLGIVLLASTALYLFPRTAVLGAIMLTGYLGGAVATHVRVGSPLFTHLLFPTYLGALLWLGLYLRDSRLRALLPFRAAGAPK